MQVTAVPSAEAEAARIETGDLSPEQREFARVFGTLLAEKWKEIHAAERGKSDGGRGAESGD